MTTKKREKLLHEEPTYQIRGGCFEIWKKFGGALKIKVIEVINRTLDKELKKRGLMAENQKKIDDKVRNNNLIRVNPRVNPRLSASTNKGFTLLEVIIAITILLVGVTAVMVLITKTVSQMNLAPSRLIAAYLTQEGIEIVRNIRDTNWLEGEDFNYELSGGDWEADYQDQTLIDTYDGDYLQIDGNGFYNYTSVTDTKFKRKITIESVDVDVPPDGVLELKVTVETAWTEKGQDQSHTAQEILYNWK